MMGLVAGHVCGVSSWAIPRSPAGHGPYPQATDAMGLGSPEREGDAASDYRGSADLLRRYRPPVASAPSNRPCCLRDAHASGETTVIGAQASATTRAHAAPLRRGLVVAGNGGPHYHMGDAEPRPATCGARRSEFHRILVSAADRPGLRDRHPGRASQPDAHRLRVTLGRWADIAFRNRRGGWRAGGRHTGAALEAKACVCRPSGRPLIDNIRCSPVSPLRRREAHGGLPGRVKESDRLAATTAGLTANGVPADRGDT
jgi:hypothetical protein